MKKVLLRLGLIASMTLALFSCDKADTHQNLIPKDADFVLTINPAQIAEKAQLSSDENAKLINKLTGALGEDDLKAEPKFAGLLLKVEDAEKFKALFTKTPDGQELIKSELAGYEVLQVEGLDVFTIAVQEDKALILVGKDSLQNDLQVILEQKEEASFASTKMFAKMNETKEDFEAVVNYGKLINVVKQNSPIYKAEAYKELLEESENLYDLNSFYYLMSLNSEAGALKMAMEVYTESDKTKEYLEEWTKATPEADDTFLGIIPKNSLFTLSFAVKGENIWDLMQKYYPKTLAQLEEKGKENFEEIGVSLEDVFKLFDGDAAFFFAGSLAEMQQKQFDARAFVEIANKETAVKLLNKFVEKANGNNTISKTGEHQYFANEDVPAHFGLKDDVLFLATKKVENVDELFEDADPSVKESSFADKVEDKRMAMIINISGIVELAKPFMGFVMPPAAIESLEQIDYLSTTSTDNMYQAESILKLKNDKNPYTLLMELAREVSK